MGKYDEDVSSAKEYNEQELGQVVLAEFNKILEERGGPENLPLSEAVGLFLAVQLKNTYATMWKQSSLIFNLFYEDIAIGVYKENNLIITEVDKCLMDFLVQESQSRGMFKEFGYIFLYLDDLSSIARSRSVSQTLIKHYSTIRILEQALGFSSHYLNEQLINLNKQKIELNGEVTKEHDLKIEWAKLIRVKIDKLLLKEQPLYWKRNLLDYANLWESQSENIILTWDNNFNIFKKYRFGEILENDLIVTYQYDYKEDLCNEGEIIFSRGSQETIEKGKIVNDEIFKKIMQEVIFGENQDNREVYQLFQSTDGNILKQPLDTLDEMMNLIYAMIGRNFKTNEVAHFDRKIGHSCIMSSAVTEYLRLVRDDPELNRVRGGKGNYQGRGAVYDKHGERIIFDNNSARFNSNSVCEEVLEEKEHSLDPSRPNIYVRTGRMFNRGVTAVINWLGGGNKDIKGEDLNKKWYSSSTSESDERRQEPTSAKVKEEVSTTSSSSNSPVSSPENSSSEEEELNDGVDSPKEENQAVNASDMPVQGVPAGRPFLWKLLRIGGNSHGSSKETKNCEKQPNHSRGLVSRVLTHLANGIQFLVFSLVLLACGYYAGKKGWFKEPSFESFADMRDQIWSNVKAPSVMNIFAGTKSVSTKVV